MLASPERKKSLALKASEMAANVGAVQSYLDTRGISEPVAAHYKLGSTTEFGSLRLSIPYFTPAGVVDIKYRCAVTEHGDHKDKSIHCSKMMKESGCGSHLYNAQSLIRASDLVVVTEGELDAVMVEGYTGFPTVGYPGTSNWEKRWRYCFDGIGEVIVIADGDDPGRKAAEHVAQAIGTAARVVDLGDGHDASSYIRDLGVSQFVERLSR